MGNSAALMAGFQPEDVLPDAPARFVRWATGLDKKLEDMAEVWDKFLSEIVAAHKEKGGGDAGEEDEDFLDVLLRLREEGADGLELTDDRIKATIEVIVFAEILF
jgi:cytochrome P450